MLLKVSKLFTAHFYRLWVHDSDSTGHVSSRSPNRSSALWPSGVSAVAHLKCFRSLMLTTDRRTPSHRTVNHLSKTVIFLSLVLLFQQDWTRFIIFLTPPFPVTAIGRHAQIVSSGEFYYIRGISHQHNSSGDT